MKLKDLAIGQRFLFVNNEAMTDIYVKKGKLANGYFLVGLPGVYDEFASHGDTEVIVE